MRQSKLAVMLEQINHEFSESGAVLLEGTSDDTKWRRRRGGDGDDGDDDDDDGVVDTYRRGGAVRAQSRLTHG